MNRPAFSFVREFEPAPAQRFCVDRHYLLCASHGVLRLEADGTTWSLPPARAAVIRSGEPIEITIAQRATTSSVLFSPTFVAPPPERLAVIDLTPLCRALLAECTQWGDDDTPLSDYAIAMFRALAEAVWARTARPSPASMPSGRSPEVRRALAIATERLDCPATLGEVAADVGLAARSLARRFEVELGMTWRAAIRRLRVLRAIDLLADVDLPVTRIAVDVGYSSSSAFNTAFRDLIGQTPTEYRTSFVPLQRTPPPVEVAAPAGRSG